MMDAYRAQVGDDNVFETRHTGTIIMEVDAGAPYRIILDPGGYVEDYGWSDEDDDDGGEDDDPDNRGGGGGKLAAGVLVGGALTAAALAKRRRQGSPTRLDDQPAA
jgi:hypothetical protein